MSVSRTGYFAQEVSIVPAHAFRRPNFKVLTRPLSRDVIRFIARLDGPAAEHKNIARTDVEGVAVTGIWRRS